MLIVLTVLFLLIVLLLVVRRTVWKTATTRLAWFVDWLAVGLLAGGAVGLMDAFLCRTNMKREVFGSAGPDAVVHSIIGLSLYSQVFLGMLLLGGLFFLWISPWPKIRNVTQSRLFAVLCAITTFVAMHAAFRVNAWAPGVKSMQSILGNLGVLAGALVLVVAVYGLLNRFVKGKESQNAATWFILSALVVQLAAMAVFLGLGIEKQARVKLGSGPAPAGPNVLLITVDTLRADHLSSFGYRRIATPGMDRLATQGVAFERAIAPTSWTLPSLVSIQTGNDPIVHGQITDESVLDPGFVTLAEAFSQKGYTTAAFLTNTYLLAKKGLDQGFEAYQHAEDDRYAPTFSGLSLWEFLLPIRAATHSAQEVTRRTLRFLDQHKSRPFYVWVHYIDPHVPYGDWYITQHPDYDRDYTGQTGRVITIPMLQQYVRSREVPDAQEIRHWNACYDAEILYLDRQIGRLLDGLDRMGLADNTLVVLTSDHGEEFWEHDFLCHGYTLYNEVVQVPMLMRWPGQLKPGMRVPTTVSLLDLAPTFIDIAGIPTPQGFQGRSLLPLLRGESVPEQAAFSHLDLHDIRMDSNHDDRYDLVRNLNTGYPLLFDAQTDPAQRSDLSRTQIEQVQEFAVKLEQRKNESEDMRKALPLSGKDLKIELDPDMADKLKALGYIN